MSEDKFSFEQIFKRKESRYVMKGVRVTSSVFWNLFLIFASVALVSLFFVGGAAAGYFASLVKDEPTRTYEDMKRDIYDYEEATEIYFANNIYLGDLPSPLERREIALKDVSNHLIEAVVATEDEYFYDHQGVVPKALFRAVYQDFSNASTQTGGSTLTQQLIKNQMLTSEVTHDRKAVEILLALRVENFFEKDEILEAYLNVVPFGRNSSGKQVAGAQAAAQGIFGVNAADLNIPQAAFIAGLPQSPFAYTPFTSQGEVKDSFDAGLNRMNTVLNRMYSMGYITENELEYALNYDIRRNLTPPQASGLEDYPFITDEVRRRATEKLAVYLMEQDEVRLDGIEDDSRKNLLMNRYKEEAARSLQRSGYKIYTTINKDIYDAQEKVVAEYENFASDITEDFVNDHGETETMTYLEEAASVLINNRTGEIVSFVAGRDYQIQNYNHATQAERPTGSTMKPLLTYAVGFESGQLQPGFLTPDIPYFYETNGDEVRNFDRRHLGFITAREALARSRNVPAVREFRNINYDISRETLMNFGFEDFMTRGEPFEGTPLGTLDMTIEANTSAFSAFANEGKHVESYMIERIETSNGEIIFEHEKSETEVFSPQTNYLMVDVMRDVLRSPGTGAAIPSYLNFQSDWAGKTGTSQGIRDSWFVGFNPNITQGIWFGYDNNSQIPNPSNGLNYGPRTQMLWAELINIAHEIDPELMEPSHRFESPGGIVSQSICSISGKLPSELCREIGLVTTDLFNSKFVPTESDDSLERVQYVRVDEEYYKSLETTPEEFTKEGVSVKEEYFDFGEDVDISEFLPEDWDDLIPDREAPDNEKTPDPLESVSVNDENISWGDHHEVDVIGYRVYYSPEVDISFTEVESVRWDEEFSYSGNEGAYYVTAVDVAGRESSPSEEVVLGTYVDPEEEKEEEKEEDEDKVKDKDKDKDKDEEKENKPEGDSEESAGDQDSENGNGNGSDNQNNGTREEDDQNGDNGEEEEDNDNNG